MAGIMAIMAPLALMALRPSMTVMTPLGGHHQACVADVKQRQPAMAASNCRHKELSAIGLERNGHDDQAPSQTVPVSQNDCGACNRDATNKSKHVHNNTHNLS